MTQPRLFYFYPENDLALAGNYANYTAPSEAVRLRRSGASLAMWTGNDGDKFICDGINNQWYMFMRNLFDLHADVFDGDISGLTPAPWGWSLPVRKIFMYAGYPPSALPTESALQHIRDLSRRSTAVTLAKILLDNGTDIAPPAVEVTTPQDALATARAFGDAVLKLPWSSSGRGITDVSQLTDAEILRRAEGTIRRQGSIFVEPFHRDALNFALLYNMHGGTAEYVGISVFDVDEHFGYCHSRVSDKETLRSDLLKRFAKRTGFTCDNDIFPISATADALRSIIGADYNGPVGVDMLLTPNENKPLALCEANIRCTMGHVATILAKKFITPGTVASFSIIRQQPCAVSTQFLNDLSANIIVDNGKLLCGKLCLTPPDTEYAFTLTV